jgi:hypothetical protein
MVYGKGKVMDLWKNKGSRREIVSIHAVAMMDQIGSFQAFVDLPAEHF